MPLAREWAIEFAKSTTWLSRRSRLICSHAILNITNARAAPKGLTTSWVTITVTVLGTIGNSPAAKYNDINALASANNRWLSACRRWRHLQRQRAFGSHRVLFRWWRQVQQTQRSAKSLRIHYRKGKICKNESLQPNHKHTHSRAPQTLWALDTQNKWSGSNVDCRIALLLLLLCANYLPLNQVCVVVWTEFTVFSVRPSMRAKFKILARLLAANQLWSRKSCQTYVNVYSWYVGLCINFISYLYLFTAFHRILPHFVIALKKL